MTLSRARRRGFTLTELMVVVTIVGVLATIGIYLFREYVYSSRSVEAVSMVQSIRSAQERWRAEHIGYLDVSTTLDTLYPMNAPGRDRYNWVQSTGNDFAKWQLLAPTVSGPVQFGYATKAGPAYTAILAPSSAAQPAFPAANEQREPWFIIQAVGDTDADGIRAYYVATSLNGELYREKEGE